MDNVLCKAKGGPANCPYHRHVFAMYKAQEAAVADPERSWEYLETYYQERKVVEQMLHEGWDEQALVSSTPPDPFEQVDRMRAGTATPSRRTGSRRATLNPTAHPVQQAVAAGTTTGVLRPPRKQPQVAPTEAGPADSVQVSINHKQHTFYRARPGISVAEPHYIRIEAARALSDEDVRALSRHLRFAYKSCINSRSGDQNKVGRLFRDGSNAFVVEADMSLSNRPNLAAAAQDFQKKLLHNIAEGTPVNSDGGQTIPGLGAKAPKLALYYDSVTDA